MPGSEVLVGMTALLFVGGALALAVGAWWVLRVALWSVLRVNLRLADQVRDANTCITALAAKPGSVEFAFEREITDRDVRHTEAQNGAMPPIEASPRRVRQVEPTT